MLFATATASCTLQNANIRKHVGGQGRVVLWKLPHGLAGHRSEQCRCRGPGEALIWDTNDQIPEAIAGGSREPAALAKEHVMVLCGYNALYVSSWVTSALM